MAQDIGFLAYDNLASIATISGGGWTLPLTNLLTQRIISEPARCSQITDLTKSQFTLSFAKRQRVNLIALCAHSLSLDALFRVTVYSDAEATQVVMTTGWTPVVARMFTTASLAWEDVNFWDGRPSQADTANYTRSIILPLVQAQAGRAIRIEIDDRANPAGFFDIGYLMVANAFVPVVNFIYGQSLGLQYRTLVDETPSGYQVFDRRKSARVAKFDYDDLNKTDAMRLFDIATRADLTDPVLFVPTTQDTSSTFREAFLARISVAPTVVNWNYKVHRVGLELREVIA